MPRRRNAAGACTTASTRAARVLKGNQNCRSERVATHGGAPRPSFAAKCSANAARKTSQCSSPTRAGSASNQQTSTVAGRFPSVLLQELRHQPPPSRLVNPDKQGTKSLHRQGLISRSTILHTCDASTPAGRSRLSHCTSAESRSTSTAEVDAERDRRRTTRQNPSHWRAEHFQVFPPSCEMQTTRILPRMGRLRVKM